MSATSMLAMKVLFAKNLEEILDVFGKNNFFFKHTIYARGKWKLLEFVDKFLSKSDMLQ